MLFGFQTLGLHVGVFMLEKKFTSSGNNHFVYLSACAQSVEQVVKPRLSAGEIVLSDRYYDSTIAYQGYGHQQDLEQIRALVKYATGGLIPDLTILLDLDVEVGLKRKT